jgi:hypothetical protein
LEGQSGRLEPAQAEAAADRRGVTRRWSATDHPGA